MWHCADLKGKIKFSVLADTIFQLDKDLYCIQTGNRHILFENDPFHPVFGLKDFKIRRGNSKYYLAEKGGIVSLISLKTPSKISKLQFLDIKIWRGQMLGKTNSNWIFQPGEPEEIKADSFRILNDALFLFTENGLLKVDSSLKKRFIPVSGNKRILSPNGKFAKLDNVWIPIEGGLPIQERNKSFWWGDCILINSIKKTIYVESQSFSMQFKVDSMFVIDQHFICIRNQKEFSLVSSLGKKIMIPKPLAFKSLNDTICGIKTKKSWFLFGISGQKCKVNPSVSELGMMKNGFIMAKAGRRYGFIDESGFIRIACRYDSLLDFNDGLAAARLGKVWGFLDKYERLQIQPHYTTIGSFFNGNAIAQKDEKYGIINKTGMPIVPFQYEKISISKNGGWYVQKNKWLGFVNESGSISIPPRFFNIIEAPLYLNITIRDGKSGLISNLGEQILQLNCKKIIVEPDFLTLFYTY